MENWTPGEELIKGPDESSRLVGFKLSSSLGLSTELLMFRSNLR